MGEGVVLARAPQLGWSQLSASADRTCGVCYYACPLPDRALKLKAGARPVVDADECVGCGSCERACIHLPQAIRITPRQV